VLAERERRYELETQRDLTGVLMGDPPPQRPRSLGAAAVAESFWIPATNVFQQPHLVAHLIAQPQLVGMMSSVMP
jgi:hypothetical protein